MLATDRWIFYTPLEKFSIAKVNEWQPGKWMADNFQRTLIRRTWIRYSRRPSAGAFEGRRSGPVTRKRRFFSREDRRELVENSALPASELPTVFQQRWRYRSSHSLSQLGWFVQQQILRQQQRQSGGLCSFDECSGVDAQQHQRVGQLLAPTQETRVLFRPAKTARLALPSSRIVAFPSQGSILFWKASLLASNDAHRLLDTR